MPPNKSPNIIKYCVVTSTAAIVLIAMSLIPFKRQVDYYYKADSVKSKLVNGIKECIVREAENQTTKFSDALSFLQTDENWEIKPTNKNTCFEAIALPKTEEFTWYKFYGPFWYATQSCLGLTLQAHRTELRRLTPLYLDRQKNLSHKA